MATQQQPQYPGQIPQQHQNVGQQRQVPSGQQHSFAQQQNLGQAQQRPAQPQQQPLNPNANYDPQVASFILEKPRNATSWEDATPEQQHVALQELHNELHKYRRNHGNVKKALNEIPSPNCRRIINELVEDQNVELARYNRTIQYRIASVVNKWRSVNRRERQLVRVDIILETEPSGFQDPQARVIGVAAGNVPQDPNRNRQPGISQGQPVPNPTNNNAGQNMQQQARPPHQQHSQQYPGAQNMGTGQQFDPSRPQHPPNLGNMNPTMPGPGNPPPPPPPPGMPPPPDMPGGPPHPPGQGGPGRPMQHPPPPHPPLGQPHGQPHGQIPMPGAFPDQIHMPPNDMRHSQGRPIEILHPDHRHQKSRRKVHHNASGSSSDSDSWESDSEDSSFVNVEYDDHIDVDRRGRGRQRPNKRSKKIQKHRSLNRARALSRSRSRGHARKDSADPYVTKSTRRHRTSDMIDDQRNGRHSPESFTTNSSRSSHNKVPPVHIHLNTNNVVEDRTRTGNASPTDLYNEKKKSGKYYTSHGMTRETSNSSSERGSGTESMNTTSAHTADDGIFDAPIRRPSFKHVQSHHKVSYASKPQNVFGQPHPSHIYDEDIDRRRLQKTRYPKETIDDYPHPRSPRAHMREPESYFDDYPTHAVRPSLPNRRATMANPPHVHNPFAQSHFPPKPVRASSYLADRHDNGYSYPQQRALADRDELDERFGLGDLHAALEQMQDKKERSTRRANMMDRRDSAFQYDGDEWNARMPLGGRRGAYDRY
jgi:hypothetical protein